MTIISNKILKESYQLIKADCGLSVGVYTKPEYGSVFAMFATNFGSVDRKFTVDGKLVEIPAGVAHFLEHKMFENEDGDAFEKFAKTGANANAFTTFDRTCYLFSATENIDSSLDILLDFVTRPYFTEKTVKKELGIIGQEIKMYDDSAGWRQLFGILDGLYTNHYVKDDIAGSVESISQITPEMLYECTKAFYSPGQMMLCVAGNITAEEVIAACDRAGFSREVANVERIYPQEPDEINFSEKTIRMPIATPMVAIGYKERMSFPVTAKEEIIGSIIMDVLCGPISDLFTRLYDSNVINGTFEGEIFNGTDYYASIISGETSQPELLLEEVDKAVRKLKENGVSEEDFITVKNSLYGNMIVDFENIEEIASNMVTAHFKGRDLYTYLNTISQVTLDDVNDQLRKMFREDRKTVFTILPSEGEEDV